MQRFIFYISSLLLVSSVLQGSEVHQSVAARTGAEIKATLGARWVNEVKYNLEIDNFNLRAGGLIAPGWSLLSAYQLEGGYNQLFTQALSVHLKFLNRAYQNTNVADNSIIPYFSWREKHFEADLGINLRFTSFNPAYTHLIFYYPSDLFQPHVLFRVAGYLIWDTFRLGIELKNCDWNYAGNTYEISYHIDATWQSDKNWKLLANLGVTPSGVNGLSVIYNRFTFVAGAEFQF